MAAPEKKTTITIDREWCKSCRICVAFCPEGVFEMDDDEKAVVKYPNKCKACGLCELRCPDMAIERTEEGHGMMK